MTRVLDQNIDQAIPGNDSAPSPVRAKRASKDQDPGQGHEGDQGAHYVAHRPHAYAGYWAPPNCARPTALLVTPRSVPGIDGVLDSFACVSAEAPVYATT
jgi:hypothetical protein